MVDDLTVAVRGARYLTEMAGQVGSVVRLRRLRPVLPDQTVGLLLDRYLAQVNELLTSGEAPGSRAGEAEVTYQKLKLTALRTIVNGQVEEDRGQELLDDLSAVRRLLDQGLKAFAITRPARQPMVLAPAEE